MSVTNTEATEASEYAGELRRIVNTWRHMEWFRLKRKVREVTREPVCDDPVSDELIRCAWLLCHVYGGPHHVGHVRFGSGEGWLEVSHYGEIATSDGTILTRMMVAAHECAVRLSIHPGGARGLRVLLHPRARTSSTSTNHPTLDRATSALRERWMACPVAIPSY